MEPSCVASPGRSRTSIRADTRALCGLIQSGVLPPGTRVPPTRELARDLACSRNVVLLAYEQLILEGYLSSRRAAGTFVSPDLPADAPSDDEAEPSAESHRAFAPGASHCRGDGAGSGRPLPAASANRHQFRLRALRARSADGRRHPHGAEDDAGAASVQVREAGRRGCPAPAARGTSADHPRHCAAGQSESW